MGKPHRGNRKGRGVKENPWPRNGQGRGVKQVVKEHRMARTKVKAVVQEPWTWEVGVCQTHPNEGAARAGQDPPVQAGRQRSST